MTRQVLMIDDDADIRESACMCLVEEGYAVHLAENGLDALERLPSLPPLCLAIVDLLMPVMGGAEFVARLRAGAHQADLPVLLMSATAAQVPLAGTRVVHKPISLPDFLRAVDDACLRG